MSSYNCPQCNSEFAFGTKFCPTCGSNLELDFIESPVCPKCNKSFPAGTKFCDMDGTKLTSPDKLLPRCVKCGTEYAPGTNFCPNDGGAVLPGTSTYRTDQTSSFQTTRQDGNYPKASLGNRFLASLIDGFITLGFALPALICYVIGIVKLKDDSTDEAIPLFLLAVFFYIIPMIYSFLKDGLGKGQSWGKSAVGLMVVYLPNNSPCSYGQSFLRNLIMTLINLFPFVGWLVEPIMVLATDDGRRLGDKAANTQVIEKIYFNR